MPFGFVLPTTSFLSFEKHFTSNTHPSLAQNASVHRHVLRNVLKKHKRLPAQSKVSNLSTVMSALDDYLPYLFALDDGLCGRAICVEEVDLMLQEEIAVEWRTSLTHTVHGREPPRVRGRGLDYEIAFTLHTVAYLYTLQARAQLLALHAAATPTAEQRVTIITTATKYLLQANSIHTYLASRSLETDASSGTLETLSQTQSGLAALAIAEATLLAVLKDDPYPAVVFQNRNENDKEWMIKPPEIPKIRAHLFARLCLASAEHAGKAEAMLSASGRIDEALLKYVRNLKMASRAKACRFFGIDAEIGGETGKAIAWLVGAKKQLGYTKVDNEGSKLKGLAKIKKDWTERREDKKIEKGGEWGSDAGRLEESRIIEMLEQKWTKMNDTINTQEIPPSNPLIASMPSGRDIHSSKPYSPPRLDTTTLESMRAPPDSANTDYPSDEDDGSSSDDDSAKPQGGFPGAFPSSSTASAHESYY